MEKMKQQEIQSASRRILGYLEAHGDAPIFAMKDDLMKPEMQFYMGLGDLILRHQVAIQERQGSFWATKRLQSGGPPEGASYPLIY